MNIATLRDYRAVMQNVLLEGYAGYMALPYLTHLPEYKSCKVQHFDMFVSKSNLVFTMQKNSSLTKYFNQGLLMMNENGELTRLIKKHKILKDVGMDCEKVQKGKELGFENIFVVFIMLLTGLLLSSVILLCEVFWKSLKMK